MKYETIHIAYADDHVMVRKGIISLINAFGGINVDIEADSGKDLITQLTWAEKLPDIILLDIHMNEMDGFQTMQKLKEKWPRIKTLVITAFETELHLIKMIHLGVNGYLLKNCNPENIKDAIINIHENGIYHSGVTEEKFFKQVQTGMIRLPHFSDNEIAYLKYCPTEFSCNQIATKMGTTIKAVEGYRTRLCDKLKVKGRLGLAMCAIQFGFVDKEITTRLKFALRKSIF